MPDADPAPVLTAHQVARRRLYSRSWACATIAWSIVRSAVVWATLGDYGVDPWHYLLVDLASAAILAVAIPRLVTSLIDRRRRSASSWGAATIVGYVIPDVYIFSVSDHLPWLAIALLLAVIYVSFAIGLVGARRKVLAGRAIRAKAEPQPAA